MRYTDFTDLPPPPPEKDKEPTPEDIEVSREYTATILAAVYGPSWATGARRPGAWCSE